VSLSWEINKFQVMFLKKTARADVFEIEYMPRESTDVTYLLDELTIICGLELGGKESEGMLSDQN